MGFSSLVKEIEQLLPRSIQMCLPDVGGVCLTLFLASKDLSGSCRD